MRIARFVVDDVPRYGVLELAEDLGAHPETVAVLNGDPLAGPVTYTGEHVALADVRLVSPVIPRSKIICLGKNYEAHARELDSTPPETPLVFMKPNTSVIGPDEPIICPPESSLVHHEGELGIVIGRICRRVPPERAAQVIFGYTVANDVTARDLQALDGQWTRAKGYDTFCPLGPWIVTHLSIDEASNLDLRVDVNGVERQHSSTSAMVHRIPEIILFVSSFATLLPGDVILTGTPEGVGPLEPGDTVRVWIEKIGTLRNPVMASSV